MSARPWLVGLSSGVLLCTAGVASAWDSKCRFENDIECKPGPETARNPWTARDSEHYRLWNEALSRRDIRLPAHLTGLVTLKVPSLRGAKVQPLLEGTLTTVAPRPLVEADVMATRRYQIAELTQLPDFSFGLWDWAQGNETCPLAPLTAVDTCHAFESHMGALNSNHFLPQAQSFYEHYHALALIRAISCAGLRGALKGAYPEFVEACDQEAFSFEAISQHYLQDAWSMGHMWERWGGPNPGDFGGGNWRHKSLLIALTSGLIHGSKGALQGKLGGESGPVSVLDPMCAPLDPAQNYYWDPLWSTLPPPTYLERATGSHVEGVGDLFFGQLTDGPYGDQFGALLDCSVSSMIEVAETAGLQNFGVRPPGPAPADPEFDLVCFGQRATNGSMYLGAGIDTIVGPGSHVRVELDGVIGSRTISDVVFDQLPAPLKDILGESRADVIRDILIPVALRPLVPSNASVADVIAIISESAGAVNIPEPLKAQFRNELAVLGPLIKAHAAFSPNGTGLAQGGLPPLLGIEKNSAYRHTADLPAEYADPRPPYVADAVTPAGSADVSQRGMALARVFHRAHVQDWCNAMAVTYLESLRDRAPDTCAICEEFGVRHLRIGSGEGDYDTSREPVCNKLPGTPVYIYQPAPPGLRLRQEQEQKLAIANWCGCGQTFGPPPPPPAEGCVGAFGGNIVDAATRSPIAGAVTSFASPMQTGQVSSAPDGTFVTNELPCSRFTIDIAAAGYVPASTEIAIDQPGTTTQLVELAAIDDACAGEPARLTGSVRDAISGMAISDAVVELRAGFNVRANEAVFQTAVSGESGRFEFAGLDAGYYALSASADGYQPTGLRPASLCGQTEERELQLLPRTSASLRFVLDWARPDDLDLHLLLPNGNEVSFDECSGSLTEAPFASLDIDHQLADGPEAISIGRLSPGISTLYVHNFSAQNEASSGFRGSGATVTVYRDGTPSERFAVPTSGSEYFWDVLEIESDGTSFTLRPLERTSNARANPLAPGEYSSTCTPGP